MKQIIENRKMQVYEAPQVEVVEVVAQGLLCGSEIGIDGNTTEEVTTVGFDFP